MNDADVVQKRRRAEELQRDCFEIRNREPLPPGDALEQVPARVLLGDDVDDVHGAAGGDALVPLLVHVVHGG